MSETTFIMYKNIVSDKMQAFAISLRLFRLKEIKDDIK